MDEGHEPLVSLGWGQYKPLTQLGLYRLQLQLGCPGLQLKTFGLLFLLVVANAPDINGLQEFSQMENFSPCGKVGRPATICYRAPDWSVLLGSRLCTCDCWKEGRFTHPWQPARLIGWNSVWVGQCDISAMTSCQGRL